jgi:hypothetical protein
MSDWKVIDGTAGPNQDIDTTSTTADVQMGLCITAHDQASTDYGFGDFIYLQGVASTVVGSVVIYEHGVYITTLAPAGGKGNIAVAMSICVADNYGWYQVKGRAVCKSLTGATADKVCYLSATAGSLDDGVVAGDEIYTSYSISALDTPATGLQEVGIDYPHVSDASN